MRWFWYVILIEKTCLWLCYLQLSDFGGHSVGLKLQFTLFGIAPSALLWWCWFRHHWKDLLKAVISICDIRAYHLVALVICPCHSQWTCKAQNDKKLTSLLETEMTPMWYCNINRIIGKLHWWASKPCLDFFEKTCLWLCHLQLSDFGGILWDWSCSSLFSW